DVREPRAMLDLRDLLAPETPFARRRARLDEERRLFGVATTRARRRLLVTAARESSQREAMVPTPFLHQLGLEWSAPPEIPEPLSRDEAEATWRRTLGDRAAAPETRAAALDALARLPGVDPDSWWYERDWTDNERPLIGDDWLASYSRLSPYENCPLNYLYQKELGLDPDKTFHMLVGSWIHDIIVRCARGELECERTALVAELRRMWRPAAFPNGAIEHRYRIECEKMIDRWLDADAKSEALATEVHFQFALDGARLHGYIDRLVRVGGHSVRIIDYKTGSSWKNENELPEDLQLGTYYLAMLRDPELAKLGDPMRLELIYLAAEDRRYGTYKNPAFDPRKDPEYESKMENRLLTLINGIRAEKFVPSEDAECRNCKFKTLCPVWPEGDEVKL
ncbi:MAG: PD-(D/E)XK nuclease family protein, partial [Actinomycetota bacterium]